MTSRAPGLLPLLLLAACAGGTVQRPPTRTEALSYLYTDDAGLQVVTAGARVQQPLRRGLSLSQLLSARLIASAGLATSVQSGTLSSPYRRARVLTSLFPEALPDERLRTTGYLGLGWSPRTGTGLHLRQGLYADSWGVRAMAPEAALAQSVLGSGLVTLSYRLYLQSGARFYAARYDALAPVRSSDPRLGTVVEHRPGLRLAWTLWGHPESSEFLRLQAGYALSLLRHVEAGNHRTTAHVMSLGLGANL